MTGNYKLIFAIYLFVLAGTISPALMVLFSCLVLRNLQKLRSRIQPAANVTQLKRRDVQLVRMLLVQILIYLLTTFLYPVDLLYSALKPAKTETNVDQRAIESFLAFFTDEFLFYLNNVAPFFTYYLTSSSFRSEVRSLRYHRRVRQIFTFSSQIVETFDLQHR